MFYPNCTEQQLRLERNVRLPFNGANFLGALILQTFMATTFLQYIKVISETILEKYMIVIISKPFLFVNVLQMTQKCSESNCDKTRKVHKLPTQHVLLLIHNCKP